MINHKVVKVLKTKINTTLINNKIKGKWSQSLNVTIIIYVSRKHENQEYHKLGICTVESSPEKHDRHQW